MLCGYVNNRRQLPNTQSAFLTKLSPSVSLVYSTFLGHLNETGRRRSLSISQAGFMSRKFGCKLHHPRSTASDYTERCCCRERFLTLRQPDQPQVGSAFISVFDAAGANLLYRAYMATPISRHHHGPPTASV